MAYTPRINLGGNYCGHDPASPRFDVAQPDRTHKFLREAGLRSESFYFNPDSLPNLNAANGSETGRQMRTEARESVIALLKAMCPHIELSTLRVGIPDADRGLVTLPLSYYAELAGLSERRAQRAIGYLKTSGFMTVTEIKEKQEDGSYRSRPAVRAIARELFLALGFTAQRLRNVREFAHKRLVALARKSRRAVASMVKVRSTFRGLIGGRKLARIAPSAQQHEIDFEASRAASLRAVGLIQQGVPPDEARRISGLE